MDLELTGKVALVTGGSAGIGAAIAKTLATEGCSVGIVGRGRDRLERTANEIAQATDCRIDAQVADLSKTDDAVEVAETWADADIVVNKAGAIPAGDLTAIDDATWRSAWDLKVFGYVTLTRAFYPRMCERGRGVIINVIGAAAQMRDPSYICGVAGNAALTALTMSLGSESPAHGVRVVGVSPGPVATERLKTLEPALISKPRPFGRAAHPEEVADTVAFLASRRAGYISGTVIMIDGGLSARSQTQ